MSSEHKNGSNGVSQAIPRREMPHSIEAEECVLSACLLDGAPMLERCIEGKLAPASFYDSNHGIVFETLLRLRDMKAPIDTATLAEEMRENRTLDQVGGFTFITQVSSRLPTTATAAHFIAKVRDHAALRDIIREAARAVETAYTITHDVEEFGTDIQKRIQNAVTAGSSQSTLIEWAGRRAGVGRVIPDDVPVLFLRDVAVCNRSNLGMMTALQKSGKSAGVGAIIASILAAGNHQGDCLGFRANNPLGHALLHYDTEQSPKDHEALIEIGRRRSGLDKLPDWLHSYGVKGVSAEELRFKFRRMIRELDKRFGGVFMSILDGGAEFVNDTNEPKECNPFVTELESLSTDYNCHILSVVHLNPSPSGQNTKSRGHLGSQLERKCETDIRLVKDANGVTTMFTASARHTPIFEKDGVRFSWDNQAQMHLCLENKSTAALNPVVVSRLRELAEEIWGDDKGLRYSEAIARIKKVCRIQDSAADSKFTKMQVFGVIEKQLFLWVLKR